MHYNFLRERVLSGEVELQYVPMDRKNADIFTKTLGLDKLRQFLGVLGLRHLDVPNLRGRDVPNDHGRGREVPKDRDAESDDEFDFGSAKEAKGGSAECPKADIRGAVERKSRSQPSMREKKLSRVRRPKTSWRQPSQMKAKTDRRNPSRFECLTWICRINRGPSGREGSRRSANTAKTRELRMTM